MHQSQEATKKHRCCQRPVKAKIAKTSDKLQPVVQPKLHCGRQTSHVHATKTIFIGTDAHKSRLGSLTKRVSKLELYHQVQLHLQTSNHKTMAHMSTAVATPCQHTTNVSHFTDCLLSENPSFFFSRPTPSWLSPGRLPHCLTLHEQ